MYHMPMAKILPGLVREYGQEETAKMMRVAQSTVSTWVEIIGGKWMRFIVMPGEQVYIRKGKPYEGPRPVMDD